MKFTWDEAKRRSNLKKHGLDFVDVPRVFNGPMLVFEDDRESYGEERLIGIGMLGAVIVLIVHVESVEMIRVISMRKADSNETNLYYQNVGYF